MHKKRIVRLSDQQRELCQQVLTKHSAPSQKARRAQILLQSDVEGPAWTDFRKEKERCQRSDYRGRLPRRLPRASAQEF